MFYGGVAQDSAIDKLGAGNRGRDSAIDKFGAGNRGFGFEAGFILEIQKFIGG